MILKPFEIKDYLNKNKVFLFHGENFGQKEEIIEELFKKNFKDCNYLYSETEVSGKYSNPNFQSFGRASLLSGIKLSICLIAGSYKDIIVRSTIVNASLFEPL